MSSSDVITLAREIAASLASGPANGESKELIILCDKIFSSCNTLRLQLGIKQSLTIITGNLLANAQPWNVSMFEDTNTWRSSYQIQPNTQTGKDDTKLPNISSRRVEENGKTTLLYRCPIIKDPLIKPRISVDIASGSSVSSVVEEDTSTAANEIGAIVIGVSDTNTLDQQLMRDLVGLAVTLGRVHYSTLEDFVSTVSSILFAPPHPLPNRPSDVDDDDDWSHDEDEFHVDGENEGGARRANGHASSSSLSHQHMDAFTLRFRHPVAERSYSAWVARHMWKFDAFSFCLTLIFKTIIIFCPGTAFGLYYKVPWQRWILGYVHGLPALLLFRKNTRRWYEGHRDSILLGVLIVTLLYQQFIVINYIHLAPISLHRSPLFTFNYTWLPTVALLYQMKFSLQAPVMAVMTAINLTLLRSMCELCFPEESTEWCCVRGATKVAAMVAAALLIVYCVEWRARRVWMLSR